MAGSDEPIADWPTAAAFMGEAYLRYSFTKGTRQEAAFLRELLPAPEAGIVLDVGCGPGRHAWALAEAGYEVVGLDLSPAFVAAAASGPPRHEPPSRPGFLVGDARQLPIRPRSVGAVISLCQGGFGLLGAEDSTALLEMAGAVAPGGVLVLSAFSAYFAVRHLEDSDDFDPARGVNRERTTIRAQDGVAEAPFDMETSCFTPRELRLLVERAGLGVEHLWSVAPGAYARRAPDLGSPELLVVARIPG